MIAATFTPAAIAEMPIVKVPGQRDCDGIYSEHCGWPIGPFYGGGGGGGIGSGRGIGGAPGEKKTPTSKNWNRQPECQQESLWVDTLLHMIASTDAPIGTVVPRTVTDPYFGDGQWIKMQAEGVSTAEHDDAANLYRLYEFNVHYMFNVATKQVFQVKMKNSFETGCVGKIEQKG